MTSARALVWYGNSDFRLIDVPLPTLNHGETIVELTTATICGSDLHTISGRRSAPCPSVLGHEGVGVVSKTRNPNLAVGQRVVFSVTAPCMECDRCKRGMSAKCRHLKKTGHESFDSDWPLSGTYATHIHLRNNQPIVAVPDSLPDAAASIAACAGATVMAVMEQAGCLSIGCLGASFSGVQASLETKSSLEGKRVLVIGIGMLGLIAVEAAVKAGAKEVVAIDLDATRLSWAERLGARRGEAEPETFDIALEFSGSEFGVQACIRSLDIGGRAVLAGSVATSPDYSLNPEWLVRGWRTVTGVHNYEPHHLQQAVDLLSTSSINWDDVVSAPITLEEIPEATRSMQGNYLRAAVDTRK